VSLKLFLLISIENDLPSLMRTVVPEVVLYLLYLVYFIYSLSRNTRYSLSTLISFLAVYAYFTVGEVGSIFQSWVVVLVWCVFVLPFPLLAVTSYIRNKQLRG